MQSEISFLIGSGFSIPDKIPGIHKIGSNLVSLKNYDFDYNTDRKVYLRAEYDTRYYADECSDIYLSKQFLLYLIKHFNNKLNKTYFNYEEFFDWLNESNKTLKEEFKKFRRKYKNICWPLGLEFNNMLNHLKSIFIQLIGRYLENNKYFHSLQSYVNSSYFSFLNLLSELTQHHVINIHTLNHDLLLNYLLKTDIRLSDKLCDGFNIKNNQFFGKVYKEKLINENETVRTHYFCKLESFDGNFSNTIRLLKLHGSVDYYKIFSEKDENITNLSYYEIIKKPYTVNEYYNFNKTNGDYDFILSDIEPLFLSGTTSKILEYDFHPFATLIKNFNENLEKSKCLIIVGYGFMDTKINDFILNSCIKNKKLVLIIDPGELNHIPFVKKYYSSLKVIEKGVESINTHEIFNLVNVATS
jgi:hypothetical protein